MSSEYNFLHLTFSKESDVTDIYISIIKINYYWISCDFAANTWHLILITELHDNIKHSNEGVLEVLLLHGWKETNLYLSFVPFTESKDSVACGKTLQSLETISKIGMSLSPNTSIGYNVKFNAELSGSSKPFEEMSFICKIQGPCIIRFW